MADKWLTTNETETLDSKVTAKLREAIYTNRFKEGQKLGQEELAELFGVSRMPIREALKQLEKEGLVELIPRRGAYVQPINLADIEELYELRAILETVAIESSFVNLKENDIRELERVVEKMEKLQSDYQIDIQAHIKLNKTFHDLLRKGCNWRRLNKMIEELWSGVAPFTPVLFPEQIERSNIEHRMMLDALKQKDLQEVKRILKEHILSMKVSLKGFISGKREL